jgi:hypothetical protein
MILTMNTPVFACRHYGNTVQWRQRKTARFCCSLKQVRLSHRRAIEEIEEWRDKYRKIIAGLLLFNHENPACPWKTIEQP